VEIISEIKQVREKSASVKSDNKKIGFVPTMGAIHKGHISLIKAAVSECDFVVVSIFVNPTQFGEGEDFNQYPRDLQSDTDICEKEGVDLVFAPKTSRMYPRRQLTWVDVESLTDKLCGACRPGHFRGVCTVCTKLFNIIQPDVAFFGQKDAQQAVVIKRMVADLNIPLEIRTCPIVRDEDGLATSSRNKYLTSEQRNDALLLYKSLCECRKMFEQGVKDPSRLKGKIEEILNSGNSVEIDYISLVDAETLEHITTVNGRTILVAVAAKVGETRLIDNIILESGGE
jgi:pantoate--beta-alanine ligase